MYCAAEPVPRSAALAAFCESFVVAHGLFKLASVMASGHTKNDIWT